MELPSWLNPTPSTTSTTPLPAWLQPSTPSTALPTPSTPVVSVKRDRPLSLRVSKEQKELMFTQFEMIWPRVIECVCGGSTLASALKNLPIAVDVGAFTSWLYKNPRYKAIYLEAKEIRAEHWTGEMIKYVLGEETNPVELDRAKFIVDTYKWMVARQNRREYGDVKTLEMNTTISITAALEQSTQRVIEASVVTDYEMDLMDEDEFKQLSTSSDDALDDENDDD